ncbi:MAG: multidrug ABC transporter permease [Spirochaetaceae bacterium 4572_59]|nr:MAG: multidrug ABC transporter permease [Spirochaetaceae bacterium 4572_59]
MKQFIAFIKKEFHHIFRDTWTMVILLLLPILMLILFGYALSTEIKSVNIAIYDPSKDSLSEEIIRKLESSEYFNIIRMLDSPFQIEEEFQAGNTGMVLVFCENFYKNTLSKGDAQIQLLTDGSDPNTAVTITNYASGIIKSVMRKSFASNPDAIRVNIITKLIYNPEMKSAYNFVPGVMGMVIMLICAMMTSISIAREKETGTMEILLASPMKPLLIILSKAVPYFFLSCINLLTILLFSVFLLKVPIAGSLIALLTVSLVYIFVSLAIGLLISSITSSQLVALLLSGMALMMPAIYLSGMIFPIENMPRGLQIVAQIIPAKWYIVAARNIMIKGLGFSSILKEFAVLSGMALILITISFKKFKLRLE